MRHALHIILALTLLLVGCYSDPRQVELVDRAEALIDSLPEASLALLDSVNSRRLVGADKARYALLHTQAQDKNYIDVTNDSLISIAVDYYDDADNLRYRGMAHYYKACVL
ncbi:MAG: tetratricopeptide repeat protein, partial [Bacteroidaceae bacterium]|nr:tetratricopeptide repeat protein [Bacteroidaceae bacterium]